MARARVSSFMSHFSHRLQQSTSSSSSSTTPQAPSQEKLQPDSLTSSTQKLPTTPVRDAPVPSTPLRTRSSRSVSAAAVMPVGSRNTASSTNINDTAQGMPPELLPIFSFLNSHANKLYQEGYFLKLNDLDNAGRPNAHRNWTECFAQLVGTVLSLWDAAALDAAAGQNGEVAPTFINLADASIKMIETLPTRNTDTQPLPNVLSISTAGKNRYLLHFNSFHSLTQWTAGIRLAMFEHSSLQELYTGSLVAGKGKALNNIRVIMERSRFRTEDWARVRFGAGTPWRRCWYVIDPPNEKEFQKEQKSLKKRSAYDRPNLPKGDVKFYDTKKTKKATPIATITDAYAAFAIYPQAKALIDQSTLVKVEGQITIHSDPESKTEGFVFVMPEVHPAVSGFEMMLRWLFPIYDTFGLYGRPTRLVADTIDSRGLMFAMPQGRRYSYLDLQDVAALVCADGSQSWSEQEWRKRLKEATANRLNDGLPGQSPISSDSTRMSKRASLPAGTTLRHEDGRPLRPALSQRRRDDPSSNSTYDSSSTMRQSGAVGSLTSANYHNRSASDTFAFSNPSQEQQDQTPPSRRSVEQDNGSPARAVPLTGSRKLTRPPRAPNSPLASPRESLDEGPGQSTMHDRQEVGSELRPPPAPTPVDEPPAFLHSPGETPAMRPAASPELRRANSRMSVTTLNQLVDASKSGVVPNGSMATAGAASAWRSNENVKALDENSRGADYPAARTRNDVDRPSHRQGLAIMTNQNGSNASFSPTSPSGRDSPKLEGMTRSNTDKTFARKSIPLRSQN